MSEFLFLMWRRFLDRAITCADQQAVVRSFEPKHHQREPHFLAVETSPTELRARCGDERDRQGQCASSAKFWPRFCIGVLGVFETATTLLGAFSPEAWE